MFADDLAILINTWRSPGQWRREMNVCNAVEGFVFFGCQMLGQTTSNDHNIRQLVQFTLLGASFVLFEVSIVTLFSVASSGTGALVETRTLKLQKAKAAILSDKARLISPPAGDSMMYQHSVGGVGGGGGGGGIGCPGSSPTNSTPPNLNSNCSPSTPPLTQQQQQQQQQPGNNSNNNNANPSQQNDGSSEMVSIRKGGGA